MDNPVYLQLKELAAGYTVEDIQSATTGQVNTLLGAELLLSDAFVENMKRCLVKERLIELDQANLLGLKDQLIGGARTWLLDNFPDVAFEIRNRVVTIWLDGKLEVENDD